MQLRKILALVLIVCIGNLSVTAAQDDLCTKEAVIASFAEASTNGTIDEWVVNYTIGDCPESVIAAVQALADAHQMLETPTDANDTTQSNLEVPFIGEYPVLRTVNALGVERTVEVWRGIPIFEIAPGVVIGSTLSEFRRVEVTTITFADGQVIEATLMGTIEDPSGQSYELAGMTEVELISLAASMQSDPPAEPIAEAWTLHITSPIEMTLTGDGLRWSFYYYSTAGYLIGGETHFTSSEDFYLTGEGQTEPIQVFFEDFAAVSYSSLDDPYSTALTVTTTNGNQVVGTLGLEATDSAGTHSGTVLALGMNITNANRWVELQLGESDKPIAFTLTKNP